MPTMFFNLFLIALLMMCKYGIAEFNASEQTCEKENNVTVTCNFIPESVPKGIVNVNLKLELLSDTTLDNITFLSSGWDNIERLELRADSASIAHLILRDNCFKGLEILQELKLQVSCPLDMFSEIFIGLDNVDTLDMSGSVRFIMSELIPALNGSSKLPGLTKLIFSNCFLYKSPFYIDDTVVQVLLSKKIAYLDVSGVQIAELNLRAVCKQLVYLRVLNVSYSTIGDLTIGTYKYMYVEQEDMKHVKTIDLSHATLPKKTFALPPGKFMLSNITFNYSDFHHHEHLKLLFTPETVNISGIIPHLTSIWIRNSELKLNKNPYALTKELILRQNNIKQLDVKLRCEQFSFSSFEHLDLSDNGLQFLHPEFLSCFPNLQKIDLSLNQLVKMTEWSTTLFEHLFSRLKCLKHINLSSNEFKNIPMKTFKNNRETEVINLSNNKLEQVQFTVKGLKKLRVLNLLGNNIHTLDSMSIDNLNTFLNGNVTGDPDVAVILKANPLSCSRCETKPFLTWLLSTKLVDVSSQTLTCFSEKGLPEYITENTLDVVEKICERKTIIIATSVSAGVIVLILVATSVIIYTQRQHKSKVQKRANIINSLRKGEGRYEFAVFLAFSNDDEDFVNTYILNPLNENLQLMTGIDRELVSTGDRHFRPGFYVHNEAYRGLDTTSVVLVVASKNFCRSSYCRNELDQAYVKEKPIVLMFIEHMDQELMIPTIKELYQRNVRILWTVENGEYKMKTTWENVCTSILDLIQK